MGNTVAILLELLNYTDKLSGNIFEKLYKYIRIFVDSFKVYYDK